ncbi:MAG TPA: hypothetical protein VML55_17845, partial [Planctomycetaceae bacterium]|nr:hypothetical protein [Planctomycetaceae bacterium]
TVVATLSPAYHQAPSLLHDARPPAAPVLPAETSLTLSHNAGPLAIDLPETDADGDRLSYQVELLTADPLMVLAYELDQQLSLRFTGNYSQNWGGANEKWLQTASGAWHFITPDGTLYRWSGSRPGSGFLSGSTVVASLDGSYHADPARLHNAQPVAGGDPGGSTVRVENGNQLVVTPGAGYVGDLRIRLTASDGVAETAVTLTIEVTNTPPTLSLADQVIGAGEGPLTLTLPAVDADGDPLTYQAELVGDPLLEQAYELDQQLGLRFTGNFSQNWGGANEKWLQSASGVWHFITPEGTLYRWNGTPRGSGFLSGSTVVATLDSSFWAEPARLYNAAPPSASTDSSVSVDGNQIVVTPHAGFTGVLRLRISVSDGLTSVSRTILVNVLDRVAVDGGFATWDGLD